MSKRADRIEAKEEESRLSCKKPDCEKDKHSYLPAPRQAAMRGRLLDEAGLGDSRARKEPFGKDRCWACGDEGVDWTLTRQRDPSLVDDVLAMLRRENIRELYWLRPFDERALARARRDGRSPTLVRVEKKIRSSVGKPANGFDGRQTSWEGDPICYAQHATGTCCRICIELWHGIPKDAPLDAQQVAYLSDLAMRYLEARSGELWSEDGR